MQEILTDSFKFGIAILSILNPLGIIPIFLSLTRDNSTAEIKKIATSCSITVVITILISLAIGNGILSFFGISIASFRIGGGVLLFTMALSMISAKNHAAKLNKAEIESDPSEIGIVPLAIPLLAGPGTISTSIIKAEALEGFPAWLGAILIIIFLGIIIKIILNYSRAIGQRMGTLGLNVMTRIMGLILLSLSIEFIATGLKDLFPKMHL